jgi:hypothetical protein
MGDVIEARPRFRDLVHTLLGNGVYQTGEQWGPKAGMISKIVLTSGQNFIGSIGLATAYLD